MTKERMNAKDGIGLKLIGPDGVVKSDTTGNISDTERRKRAILAALIFKLLKSQEKKHV